MKRILIYSAMMVALVMCSATTSRAGVVINKETFPDDAFRAYISSEDDTAIEGLKKNPTDAPATYYDLRGYRLNQPRKGLNIIRTENGKYKKVLP